MNTKTSNQPFAIVPHDLTAHTNIEPSVKIILTHCLEKYQTKTTTGLPWTFSVPVIAAGTGLSDRTVRRHIKSLLKHRVLKHFGCLTNGKRKFDVFQFDRAEFDSMISTADKMAVVIPNASSGFDALLENQRPTVADKLSVKLPLKNKKVEERSKKEDDNNKELKSQPLAETVAPPLQGAGAKPTLEEKIKQRFCIA